MRGRVFFRLPTRIVLTLLGMAVSVSIAEARSPSPDRPNILLLVAEDMSSRVGAFGDPVALTPNLDRLATQGTRYSHVFTAAGVCAPSRAALMTGLHPISIGAQHMRTSSRPGGGYRAVPPPEVKAFPEWLRLAGYYTFTTSKLDYQFSGTMAGSGPFSIWDDEGAQSRAWATAQAGQPFFGLINFQVTHESGVFTPLGRGWPHSAMHLLMQLVRAFLLEIPEEGDPVDASRVKLPPYYPDTPIVRADLARHYNNIHQMDREVGEILAALEADDLVDSTIVIWTTDHGDGLPRAKRDLFDSGIRVPMIIRWPERWRPADALPGAVDARLISFVDLAPTILGLAGVEGTASLQGRDFAKTADPIRDFVFASRDRIDEFEDRERAVRSREYKYIRSWNPLRPNGHHSEFRDNQEMMLEMWKLLAAGRLNEDQRVWFEPTGRERLYHLATDPHELRNLVGDPAHGDSLQRMRAAYRKWAQRVEDWSDRSEEEMVESMWPGGREPRTATPEMEVGDGKIVLKSATEGASIGYRIDDARERLYDRPFSAPKGARIRVRAVRYGYEESIESDRRLP